MLVLFTSYTALKKTAQAITGPLAREEIYVYEQGDGASPNALLESFKATERAVLLGTRSFWEGVDVPGDSLSKRSRLPLLSSARIVAGATRDSSGSIVGIEHFRGTGR